MAKGTTDERAMAARQLPPGWTLTEHGPWWYARNGTHLTCTYVQLGDVVDEAWAIQEQRVVTMPPRRLVTERSR